jgi:plastocyanin
MEKKYCLRTTWSVVIFGIALAGCNRNTTPNRPFESTPQPAQYTAINDATAGTVVGTIHFTGKAPKPILIDMAQDPACGLEKTPNYTEQYVVHDGKMANVFVYVKDGLGNRVYMPTKTPVVLDQKGCRYIPHVIGTMVGQPVEFRNSDPTMHNVHIVPPNDTNAAGFDISQPPMSGAEQHVFRTPGLMIPVRCNNHPWMEAFLNVVKNPFFAVSGTDGKFEIQGLPPGNYTLVAVQEKLGTQTQQITVKSRQTTEVNFTFSKS